MTLSVYQAASLGNFLLAPTCPTEMVGLLYSTPQYEFPPPDDKQSGAQTGSKPGTPDSKNRVLSTNPPLYLR